MLSIPDSEPEFMKALKASPQPSSLSWKNGTVAFDKPKTSLQKR
jgi:hypothetical protein